MKNIAHLYTHTHSHAIFDMMAPNQFKHTSYLDNGLEHRIKMTQECIHGRLYGVFLCAIHRLCERNSWIFIYLCINLVENKVGRLDILSYRSFDPFWACLQNNLNSNLFFNARMKNRHFFRNWCERPIQFVKIVWNHS